MPSAPSLPMIHASHAAMIVMLLVALAMVAYCIWRQFGGSSPRRIWRMMRKRK
jgi:hypothetical protein